MMIGSSKDREAISSLQDAVRTLSSQLATVIADISTLAQRHAEIVEKTDAFDGALTTLRDDVQELRTLIEARYVAETKRRSVIEADLQDLLADRRGMALLIAANTEQLETQAEVIAQSAAQLEDKIKQCRGHQVRLERQAEADLIELRETDAALASSLLRLRPIDAPITGD